MVEDGIAILKVGPALTFGLREALFALDHIEKTLVSVEKRANFVDVLEEVMLANPKNWQKHYHGTEEELAFARKYSFSDRARYYIGDEKVQGSIDKLLANLEETGIPMSILHQYLPKQYDKIVAGELENKPVELIKDGVVLYMEDYEYACY
jgi:D-tagatose-1,6-bisphosphate aldolase subunit GatZ/KbaZ